MLWPLLSFFLIFPNVGDFFLAISPVLLVVIDERVPGLLTRPLRIVCVFALFQKSFLRRFVRFFSTVPFFSWDR